MLLKKKKKKDFLPDRTANEDLLFTFSTEEYFRLS